MSNRIVSYKGLLPQDTIKQIRLTTIKGEVGYRIIKLALMPSNLNSNQEACFKIYTVSQATATFEFDFDDPTLIGAAYYTAPASADTYSEELNVIIDRVIFNQDIYLTHKNNDNVGINYYLELEAIKLDENEATAVILKNFRNTNSVT